MQFDKLTITANAPALATFSNLNHASGYQQHSCSPAGLTGQTVTLKLTGRGNRQLIQPAPVPSALGASALRQRPGLPC